MFDLLITNGRFVTPAGIQKGWLGVTEGLIATLGAGEAPSSRRVIDAGESFVLPGGIDPHVHFRDPGFLDKEDFSTGSAAAAAGGVTTVFDMPNTRPAVLTPEVLSAKRDIAASKSYVDFGLFAAVDASNTDQIPALAAAGAIAFKVFMYARSNPPPAGILDDGRLWEAFAAIGATGRVACVHAENDALARYFTQRVQASGRRDPQVHLDARPALCEVEAIQRAILLAHDAGAHVHICHMSSGAGANRVRAAKEHGRRVTAETGPQNLLLDDTDYARIGAAMKMTPPIRTADDAAALWRAVHDGTVDMLATDHAPHTPDEKHTDDIFEAASGIIGVETTLPLMLTEVNAGRLSLSRLVQLRSERPAQVFGIYPQKGVIQIGSDADLVIVDMDQERSIRGERLHSRSRVTPFEGRSVRGGVRTTIVRGHVVYHNGELGEPAIGRMVTPRMIRKEET